MPVGKPGTRQSILERNHISFQDVRLSKKWFDDKLATIPRTTPNKVMNNNPSLLTSRLMPGKMYMFFYMPKGKDDLPYYDMVPLVLPFARDSTHFTGLNIHYLDYVTRFRMFKELLRITNSTTLTEDTKMKYTWGMIKDVAKMAPAQACVKQYLFSHVKSMFMEVPPTEWATAALLPTHRFVGATQEQVWKDSRRVSRR